MAIIYAGAKAPEQIVMNITPGTSGVDLSTVTAASLLAHNTLSASGVTTVTWAATMTNQTTNTLTLTYAFAANGLDVVQLGPWSVVAKLTIPGGVVRTVPVGFTVQEQFAAT